MTTLQMQFAPHFQVPITGDPMELTANMDERGGAGDELEIDLDLTGDDLQDGEDEFMGEEDMNAFADSTSVDEQKYHVAVDDEMDDESYAQGQVDERSSIRDEDIEGAEYTGPGLDESTIIEPEMIHPEEHYKERLVKYKEFARDQNYDQDYQEQAYVEQEHHEHLTNPETESGVAENDFPNGPTGRGNSSHDVAEEATGETSDGYVDGSKEGTVNHGAADQVPGHSDIEGPIAPEAKPQQVGEEVLQTPLDPEIVAQPNVGGSHAQEKEPLNGPGHLHPIILDYQGDEMFLFPPTDQTGDYPATFLLTDEQLAYSTIRNLLEACRGVLKGSLSEQDELMININDLDLHISESTTESASTKLSEVLGLYVCLQQNDGLEKPPPLYMDLTTMNRFSRRLDVLRYASVEGKGLSQVNVFQETENDQQQENEGETHPSSHTALLLSKENYAPKQQPGEEAERSMDKHGSHSNQLPSENLLLETDLITQGTESYPITESVHENNNLAGTLLGSDSSTHRAGIDDDSSSEAAAPKISLEPAQRLACEFELQRAEGSIVDDGDFIDYEEVGELKGGTSSASSTLQGDAIDLNTVQEHAVPDEPFIAEKKKLRSARDLQDNTGVGEEVVHDFEDEKDTIDVGVLVEEEQLNLAEIRTQDSDEKGQSLSGQFHQARVNDQDASIFKESDLQSKVNVHDLQHEASAQYEDDVGSYRHDMLQEQGDEIRADTSLVADANFNGEPGKYSSTQPFQSESDKSGTSFRDDELERINDSEAENKQEEAENSLANDNNDNVPQPQGEMNTQPSFFVGEPAQTQEDDDEITYEDEEYDTDLPHELAKLEQNVATSPGSLKRARSLHEDDDAQEEDLQGAKRVRSG